MTPEARRKRSKGDWSKLRDAQLLVSWMEERDMTQARLARYAEVSRQFINQLVRGDKATCTPFVAQRIEEGLGVVAGTLFDHKMSSTTKQTASTSGRVA